MALVSPGVQVTVIDESFYTPAEPGTTPLIVVATAENKSNAAGTGTAAGTTAANAGKAFRITSQRELVDTFGVPFFEKTATANPVHGGEVNEYGLLAAYSYLGSSNGVFIVRANVDLAELVGQAIEPGSQPDNGKWWVDTDDTTYGVQEWNNDLLAAGGQKFTSKTPIVLTDSDVTRIESGTGIISGEVYRRPKGSVGSIGDYAIVFETVDGTGSFSAVAEQARLFYKSAGNSAAGVGVGEWVLVGSQEWVASHPVARATGSVSTGTAKINGTTITVSTATLAGVASAISGVDGVYASVSAAGVLQVYSDGATSTAGDSTLSGQVVISDLSPASVLGGITAGTYLQPALQQSPHTAVPLFKRKDTIGGVAQVGRPTGSVWVKTTESGAGARWRVKRYNSATQAWEAYSASLYENGSAALYNLDRAGGGLNIPLDSIYVQTNANEEYSFRSPDDVEGLDASLETASFRVWRRRATGTTAVTSAIIANGSIVGGSKSFSIKESLKTSTALSAAIPVTVVLSATASFADQSHQLATAINQAGLTNVEASVTSDNRVTLTHKLGGEIRITDTSGVFAAIFTAFNINTLAGTDGFFTAPSGSPDDFVVSNWKPLAADNFYAGNTQPLNEPTDGQLWYNPEVSDVDIMIHNGTTWVGYRDAGSPYVEVASDRVGYTPIVAASNPYISAVTVTGDLWISTADIDNYPTIYRYDTDLPGVPAKDRWVLVDKADQVTEEGIVFGDARWSDGGTSKTPTSIKLLAKSNHLDPDAPDPALYPKGMLLWNLRRSSGNVKRYVNSYIDTAADNVRMNNTSMDGYEPDRWVTASPNGEDGSGTFRRKAQRIVVTQAMKSVIDTSLEIRDEERRNFNLIACPGYPEAYQNLINLNIDRGLTAFIIADTPLRLGAGSTGLLNWATNANGALDNGEQGLVSYDEYSALYYPNGFTTDLGGSNAVVPASHMMLKTISLSDQVSYPWFAPAGTRRGGIVNATSVGYLDAASGEFQTVQLSEGLRDTLYDQKINPIPFFVGIGHVAFGQKTRARNASSLDRINVARLVVYLRSQLNKLARPYLFEPNDQITRDEIKGAVDSLLLELVGLRAIYDFVAVCDDSNNTPARIDRNELYVDIAIVPTKAVEFIYIPLRLKNTGEI